MKHLNRWVYAVVGVVTLFFAGVIYAWSVLSTQPNPMSRMPDTIPC